MRGNSPFDKVLGSREKISNIADCLKGFTVEVNGTKGWNMAQVTAGGIDPFDFSADTMESRLYEGLYAAGEILDVDGDCGGYNLQWAWATGAIAGRCAGREEESMPRCEKTGPVKNKK